MVSLSLRLYRRLVLDVQATCAQHVCLTSRVTASVGDVIDDASADTWPDPRVSTWHRDSISNWLPVPLSGRAALRSGPTLTNLGSEQTPWATRIQYGPPTLCPTCLQWVWAARNDKPIQTQVWPTTTLNYYCSGILQNNQLFQDQFGGMNHYTLNLFAASLTYRYDSVTKCS